ncbi:MAG: MarR family transcriptional regulator, partial [Pseudomonadota bacterium]
MRPAIAPLGPEALLFLTEEQLRQGAELMFFAYRDFTSDPDAVLAERG